MGTAKTRGKKHYRLVEDAVLDCATASNPAGHRFACLLPRLLKMGKVLSKGRLQTISHAVMADNPQGFALKEMSWIARNARRS
jgi:hypothetical protein